MANIVVPLIRGLSRVWIIPGRARPDHVPEYKANLAAQALSVSKGDITPVFQPDHSKYGSFVQVGSYRGEEERPTISLVGNYAFEVKSRLLELINEGCPVDIQIHLGQCEDPTSFTDFRKILILEDAQLTTYDTDEIGTLAAADNSQVTETVEISAARVYEFLPLALSERTPEAVTNELIDIVICDSASCGDCEVESDGCQKIYAISNAPGGSPGTPPDLVFSVDKGINWNAQDIDTLGAAVNPNGVDCVGNYVVVVSESSESAHIALKSEVDSLQDFDFNEITTGFVTGGGPRAISSAGRTAFIVGAAGYVYKMTDATAGVTVLDAGSATISQLNAVDTLSEDFAVAVGNDGVVLTISNDLVSLLSTPPVGVGVNLNTVVVKDEKEWWVGTNGGALYYTLDSGATWTLKALPGTAPSAITDISFSSASVMYVAATVDGNGKLYLSVNGGQEFDFLPQTSVGPIPVNDRINAIATCIDDVDFVVGVGLADDATDGYLVVGNDAGGSA